MLDPLGAMIGDEVAPRCQIWETRAQEAALVWSQHNKADINLIAQFFTFRVNNVPKLVKRF